MPADFEKTCDLFLGTILGLAPGDRLLLYADEADGNSTAAALQAYAGKANIATDVLPLQHLSSHQAMEAALNDKISTGNYTAVCELSVQYYYPSVAWKTAAEKGCRVYAIGAMDQDAFVRCIGQVDHQKMYEFGLLLQKLLRQSRSIEIRSEAGTHIVCSMNSHGLLPKIGRLTGVLPSSQVWEPSGMLSSSNHATFMSGQVAFLGLRDSISGTVVFDGMVWPPDGLTGIAEPIILKIDKGDIKAVEGSPTGSAILKKWLSGKSAFIEHFCFGYNPGARLGKNMVEAERAFGHITVGFGKYPFHSDGIMTRPTLVVDGQVMLSEQQYVHSELLTPSRKLSLG
jgi:2,5-dihydroxypyridine 5,6-dioxygenase